MRKILNKIQAYINSLDSKRFQQYIGALFGIIFVLISIIIFNYYRTIHRLKSEISTINDMRLEAQSILEKAQLVKKEQREIDAILAKEENFKIAGYFEDLLSRLGFAKKKLSQEINTAVKEGNYQESILQAKFTAMTMKDVTELLQEIEANKRVFTKELDLTASRNRPGTLDVTLTIATLEPKPKELKETSE